MSHDRSKPMLPLAVTAGVVALLVGRMATTHRSRSATVGSSPDTATARHKVVIVGAGFGGLQAALGLSRRRDIALTIIDSQNHHLFQPLLYQVATAALSPDDIAAPVRGILPAGSDARVLMARVTGIDTAARRVSCGDRETPYDTLILATGSTPSYFGHDDWSEAAPGLKTLDDAVDLRNRILGAFEQAALVNDAAERDRLLTFVLIGGGATGVEMAGSIAELAHSVLSHDDDLKQAHARIVLIESGSRLLAGFASDLSDNAAHALAGLGVEIRTDTRVIGIEPDRVVLDGGAIPAGTIIWTAGTQATPVAKWLDIEPGHGGRVPVDGALRVAAHPAIRVIGDAALALDPHGKPFPGLAPVAKQQGHYVARSIVAELDRHQAPPAFTYSDYGTLATIGRNRAVAEFGRLHLTGTLAWLTWAVAHIFFLIGFRSRVMVSLQWMFAYVTHQHGSRLIIHEAGHASRPESGSLPAKAPG